MVEQKKITPFEVIRIKDIQNLMKVSKSTAERYYSDIKITFSLKVILVCHLCDYFKLSIDLLAKNMP